MSTYSEALMWFYGGCGGDCNVAQSGIDICNSSHCVKFNDYDGDGEITINDLSISMCCLMGRNINVCGSQCQFVYPIQPQENIPT
tara:strand:- start:158 stop:412 length:255 start_codon:yes stop_codon:yes gene_type:complete